MADDEEEEEEVFGFAGNVFIESIDVEDRKKVEEERKAREQKEEEERKKLRRAELARKGQEYEERLKAQLRAREAELSEQREQAKKRSMRSAHADPQSDVGPVEGSTSAGTDEPLPRRRGSGAGDVAATWEMTMVSGANASTLVRERRSKPVDRIAGGGIAAPPNNFLDRGRTDAAAGTKHSVGGSYVPDRLLEAHRRMHASDQVRPRAGTNTVQSGPAPRSLFRSSEQVIARANAWIKSFSIETPEELEARMLREIRSQKEKA